MNAPLQHVLLEDAPIPELRRQVRNPIQLLQLITAGRSILTVRSHRTSARYTLRFRRPDPEPGKKQPIWVSVLGGPEGGYLYLPDPNPAMGERFTGHEQVTPDRRAWSFMGTIWPEEGRPWKYNHSAKSKLPETDPAVKATAWIARMLPFSVDHLMKEADWWHEGRCGRCGRRLTVPESIESGFGPECARRIA